jgi:methionine-rich copper-binding protein CopC
VKTSSLAWAAGLVGILILFPQAALAKPNLDHSDPKAGSELDVPPTEIKVWFTEEVNFNFCSLEVDDGQGKQVDAEDTHQDPDDKKELIISIPTRIYNGEYTVIWRVTSLSAAAEQHDGKFKFTINNKD